MLGDDAVERAISGGGAFATAIPADRWGDAAAYALLVPLTSTAGERGLLCAMRHGIPFDAVEVVAGEAAATLLSMAFSDAQAVAIAERETSAAPNVEHPPLRVAIVESHPATRIGLETILERAGVTVSLSCATLAEALSRSSGTRLDVVLMGTVADATPGDAVHRLRAKARVEVIVIADERRGTDAHAALRAGAVGQIARDAAPVRIIAALHAAAAGLATVDAVALDGLLRASRAAMPAPAHPEAPREAAGEPSGLERRVTDRLPDPVIDRANDRGTDHAAERTPERTAERATERAADRVAERAAGRAADRASDRVADRTAEGPGAERSDKPAGALSPREMELLRYLAEGYTNKEIARVMVLAEDTVKKGVQSLIAKLGAADRTHAVVLALRSGLID